MNGKVKAFLKRKDVVFSASRYGIDALGAMAQGLFASLLIGTILSTLGEQLGIAVLVTIGGYAKAATGPGYGSRHRLRPENAAAGVILSDCRRRCSQ